MYIYVGQTHSTQTTYMIFFVFFISGLCLFLIILQVTQAVHDPMSCVRVVVISIRDREPEIRCIQ